MINKFGLILLVLSSCQASQESSQCLKLGESSNFKNSHAEFNQKTR